MSEHFVVHTTIQSSVFKIACMHAKIKQYYLANRKEFLVKRKAARATARASAQNYNLHLARQRARCGWHKCEFAVQEPKSDITEQ